MATAKFLLEARRFDAPMIALVKVTLTSPSSKTLYLSSNFIETPDFRLWEGGIVGFEPIRANGSFLGTGPDPVTAGFSLASRHGLGFQPITKNITNLFTDHRWIGAKVEIYLWSQRLTSFADAQLQFSGIVQNYTVHSNTCEVRCLQRQDYDKIVSPVFVDRDKFPRSPERSVGLPLPIVYGAIKGPPFRVPWAAPYGTHQNAIEDCHGGQVGVPGIVVDTGRGGVNQKMEVRFAAHALKSHGVTADSTQYSIQVEDRLGSITPTELFSASTGAGFRLGDEFDAAVHPVVFVEQSAWSANPCDNAPYGMDVYDEASFARFRAQGTPGAFVQGRKFRAETATPKGVLVEAFLRMAYSTGPSGLSSFHVATLKNGGGGAGILSPPPNSSTPTTVRQSLGTAWGSAKLPNDPWNFSEIEVTFEWLSVPAPGISEEFRLYFIGIEVVYKPEAKVWSPGYTVLPKLKRTLFPNNRIAILEQSVVVPPDTEIEAQFYGTFEGMADDGSGTYTGVAIALIERPCDIAHHLLRNYGGQSAGQVENGAGVFGSFIDARDNLKTWKKGKWKCALAIAEASSIETQIRRLAEAGLAWAYIDRFTDKWVWVPWTVASGTDYNRKVYRDDVFEFEIDSIPSGSVPSGVRIPYAWDAATRRFLFASHVSAVSSRAGQAFFDVRDEYLTVVAGVNDRFEIDASAVKYAKTFAAGSYTDETFIPVLQSINDVVSPMSVAFGGRIVAGENARIDFFDGASRNVNLAAGLYDMEGLAAEVASKMNSVSSGWSCTYSRTTRKFTISKASGTAQLWPGGQAQFVACNAAIGFTHDERTGALTYTGDFEVEEYRIAISASFNFFIEFATGVNGTQAATPKSCADLLGFDGRQDTPNRKWQSAHSPKGWREKELADAAAIYGQTREVVVEGRAIYDSDTARELRNRLVDWLRVPRIMVRFRTTRMPDVRRGELVRFDDFDNFGVSFPKAGSDGLWAGRRFRVLKVQQRLGPSFDQEIECIENGDASADAIIDDAMLDYYGGDAVIPAG